MLDFFANSATELLPLSGLLKEVVLTPCPSGIPLKGKLGLFPPPFLILNYSSEYGFSVNHFLFGLLPIVKISSPPAMICS